MSLAHGDHQHGQAAGGPAARPERARPELARPEPSRPERPREEQPGAKQALVEQARLEQARMEPAQVVAADGAALAARIYWPAGQPRRAVLIVPAMGVPQAFYAAFATWLAEQGLAVFSFDFRGMGESAPASLRGFRATIDDWATLDVPAAMGLMHQRLPQGLPWAFLGHSLGGQIFGLVPGGEHFERMVTVASGSGYWRHNSRPLRYYVHVLWQVLAPLGIAVAGYFPGRRLGQVGDLPAGVMWQWRRWCLHPDYLGAEGRELRQRYAAVHTPIRAVLAEDDELISPEGVLALYRHYPNARVDFVRLRPREHGLPRIGHFGLFNRRAQAALWPQALRWLAD